METTVFSNNTVLFLDISRGSGATQSNIGAVIWQPRKHHLLQDTAPLEEKKGAPTHSIFVFEFIDCANFVNLDALVVREKPKFAFMSAKFSDGDRQKIFEMFERSGIECSSPSGLSSFKWPHNDPVRKNDLEVELASILNVPNLNGHAEVMTLSLALHSLACLLTEIRADNENNVANMTHELFLGKLDKFMRLDSSAADAIMLLPDKKSPHDQHSSLYAVLNHCRTSMGSRVLESWLRQPLVDRCLIEARLDLVEKFKHDMLLRGSMMDALKNSPDLDLIVHRLRSVSKSKSSRASLVDVHRMYHFAIHNLPSFLAALGESHVEGEKVADSLRKYSEPLEQCDQDMKSFKQLVEHVLDFEALPDLHIKPAHSPELTSLAEECTTARNEVDEIYETVQAEWSNLSGGKSSIRLDTHKDEGFVMRLPSASDEQKLRKEIPQIQILSILKSGVVFTTEELRQAALEYLAIDERYVTEQASIVEKVVSTAATFVPVMETAARLIAEMDVLLSFAHVASHCPAGEYVRPTFVEDGEQSQIRLIGARHPCVELQDGVSYIPNNYEFARVQSRFQIVTGPNMGGKSTYIRGLGSIIAMAQIGSFVPCTEASVPIVDSILARVGAGDSQARGLSTFMAEMLEASTIVRTATSNSLVIIDELGRVKNIGCWTIFATHFHELTTLAVEEEGVINRHVTAQVSEVDDEVTFLYEVQEGCCQQSYGVHVARMAHFPKSVISCATEKAAELEGSGGPKKRVKRSNDDQEGQDPKLQFLSALRQAPMDSMTTPQRIELAQNAAMAAGLGNSF